MLVAEGIKCSWVGCMGEDKEMLAAKGIYCGQELVLQEMGCKQGCHLQIFVGIRLGSRAGGCPGHKRKRESLHAHRQRAQIKLQR
eukprot:1139987-Pelagomonas_calceolata.AAC.4